MKFKSDFTKTLAVNASIIVGSFVLAIVGIYFLGRDISKKSVAIAEKRDTVVERSQKISLVGELGAQAPEARELESSIISRLLPREEGLLPLHQHLDGLARATGVDMSFSFSGSPQAPTASSPGYININMGIRGELGPINNFISSLEFRSTRFLVEIANVSIREVESAYRADVTGRVFFANE